MRFIAFAFVLVLAFAVSGSEAASAIEFVGYNTTSCPISGGAVRFNATAEPQKCFSFTNLVNGQEPCVSFFVLREASNTPSFDVYDDSSCSLFRRTVTFDSLCVSSIDGVPSTCSGASVFQMRVVGGQECTTNCIQPVTTTSDSTHNVPSDYSFVFAVVLGFGFMFGATFI